MVSPEDLSVEHSRELARNRTDMRFMEDDEEKAYSWIRFWCEDECKAVKDLKYQKVKLRHRAEAKKAILKTIGVPFPGNIRVKAECKTAINTFNTTSPPPIQSHATSMVQLVLSVITLTLYPGAL